MIENVSNGTKYVHHTSQVVYSITSIYIPIYTIEIDNYKFVKGGSILISCKDIGVFLTVATNEL